MCLTCQSGARIIKTGAAACFMSTPAVAPRRSSSDGESDGFITRRSAVRSCPPPPEILTLYWLKDPSLRSGFRLRARTPAKQLKFDPALRHQINVIDRHSTAGPMAHARLRPKRSSLRFQSASTKGPTCVWVPCKLIGYCVLQFAHTEDHGRDFPSVGYDA
jgi:hypothetical protein